MLSSWTDITVRSRQVQLDIGEQVNPMRDITDSSIAIGRLDVPNATDCLQAIRWPDRVSHPVSRIALHIQQAVMVSGK
jgi:phosphate:Na+ symporter